jgi:hypothetical protein
VRAFDCDHCGLLLFFENRLCLRCGTPQGFVSSRPDLATLEPALSFIPGRVAAL